MRKREREKEMTGRGREKEMRERESVRERFLCISSPTKGDIWCVQLSVRISYLCVLGYNVMR